MDQNGENLALLIPEGVNNPVFSPGSGFIAYIEYTNSDLKTVGRIVRIDLDGGNRQVLATIKAKGIKSILANYYIRDLSWSPDRLSISRVMQCILYGGRAGQIELHSDVTKLQLASGV